MATTPNTRLLEMIDNATKTMPMAGSLPAPAVRLLLAWIRQEAANDPAAGPGGVHERR